MSNRNWASVSVFTMPFKAIMEAAAQAEMDDE